MANPALARPPAGIVAVVARPGHLLAAGVLLSAVIGVTLWSFARFAPAPEWDLARQPGGWLGVGAIVALSAVVHEALHALAWRALGGVPWRAVSFVPTWRGLGLNALLRTPVSMTVFRAAALVPALAMGVVPLGVAFATGSGLTALWGAFFLFECITDVALLVATRALPSEARVVSHPTELGCVVVAAA